MNKPKAVILMSGGMDSALCCAIAQKRGYELAALHVNYGQRTQIREERAFEELVEFYKIKHKLNVDISYLVQIGGSSLTDMNISIPDAKFSETEIPSTYVPFRNANLLSIAVSWAEVINGKAIFIGAMQLDSSGYPDCRHKFFHAFQHAVNLGTKPDTGIKIKTPLINLTKKQIVTKGKKLKVPFDMTWSCYSGSDLACGVCESCILRLRGFSEAGIKDPIQYQII